MTRRESQVQSSYDALEFWYRICSGSEAGGGAGVIVFEGARLIAGDGSAPIEDAVFVVESDRIMHVRRRADIEIPRGAARVDLSGKTVVSITSLNKLD